MTQRLSPRTVAFVLLLVGGGLGVVAAAQPWWRAVSGDTPGGGGAVSVAFSGVQATAGLSQALAVVALAGTLLILVLRARGRRVVGALLAVVGAGIAGLGALRVQPSADAVRTQVREVSLADQFALTPTAWPWVFALAGAVVLAGSALTVVTAGRWASRPDRFQPNRVPPGEVARPVHASDDPADVWKAMDAGMDPTATDPGAATTGSAAASGLDDPDVHNEVTAVTMADTEPAPPSAHTESARPPSRSLE